MSIKENSDNSDTSEPPSKKDKAMENGSKGPYQCCSIRYRKDMRRARKRLKRLRMEVREMRLEQATMLRSIREQLQTLIHSQPQDISHLYS